MPIASKYEDIDVNMIRKLIEYGHTDEFICQLLGFSRMAFLRWRRKYPKFAAKVAEWKATADERVERALYERAVGYRTKLQKQKVMPKGDVVSYTEEVFCPPDPTSCMFWLKNRKPEVWRGEKIEHTGHVEHEHSGQIEHIELEERIAQLTDGRLRCALQ